MLTSLKGSSLAYKCAFYRSEHNAKGDPLAYKCAFYRSEHNAKGGPLGIEF